MPSLTMRPFPVAYFGHVLAMTFNIFLVLNALVANELFQVRRAGSELRYSIDHIGN